MRASHTDTQFFTQMDTARCCGFDIYIVFLVISNILCLIYSHDEPTKKKDRSHKDHKF